MAKKSKGPNKSQAIRDYYKAHPNAKPKDVVSALKKKGIVVSAQFVSTIRSVSKKKGGKMKYEELQKKILPCGKFLYNIIFEGEIILTTKAYQWF